MPLTATRVWSSPRSEICPAEVVNEVARITPLTLMMLSTRLLTVAALSCTRPPSAVTWPDWSTMAASGVPLASVSVFIAAGSTTRLTSLSPYRSSTKASPAASATLPRRAVITPLLDTLRPTSAAKPPSPTVMRPWFSTRAPARPGSLKSSLPAMKLALPMLAVDAVSAPTSTCAVRPNRMPLALTR